MKKPTHGKPVPKAKTKTHRKPAPAPRPVRYGGSGAPAGGAGGAAGPVRGGAGVPVRGGSGGPAKRAKPAAKAKHHPRRKLALGEGVACCSAEALAASLRLAGAPVGDEDVLALYWRTAAHLDEGASILATLDAAAEFGLAGCRLTGYIDDGLHGAIRAVEQCFKVPGPAFADEAGDFLRDIRHSPSIILGLDLPGPHAVLATPDGWWSWGELHDPACWPDAVIEEAWTIEWEV